MIRNYTIIWYPTKEGQNMTRKSLVKLSKPTGQTAVDAKSALNLFISQYGGLKKNTIIKIIEMDENGQIGEDIIPIDNNSIVPTHR